MEIELTQVQNSILFPWSNFELHWKFLKLFSLKVDWVRAIFHKVEYLIIRSSMVLYQFNLVDMNC